MKPLTFYTYFLVAGFLLLTACSTTVTLEPAISEEPVTAKIQKFVGVSHNQEFLTYQRSADAYGNRHEFIFPLGEASDALFLKIYPMVFQKFEPLENWTPGRVGKGTVDAVLQPQIEAFQFPLHSLKGPYWAEVIYRFNLYTPDGKTIYSWRVKGWGESGDGSGFGEYGPIGESVEKAISNAARRFVGSFENIPELKRWVRGVPIEGATAPVDIQSIRPARDFGVSAQEGSYDSIVTVKTQFSRLKKSEGLSGIRVFLKNEGNGRIAFDPSDFEFSIADAQKVDPIPASFIAAMFTTRYGRLPLVAPGVGPAALPLLIFSLVNAVADAAEQKELKSQLATWRREELHETVLQRGASVEGMVFFALSSSAPVNGELKVPVVELDKDVRYIVRIPLRE